MKEEVERLKAIVNDIFLVELDSPNRTRDVVDARKVYSKILRESGCGYEEIAKTINKNHSTIQHYVKDVEYILTYDKVMMNKYIACKNVFIKESESISQQIKKDADIYVTVVRLANELEEAISSKNKTLNNFVNYIENYQKQNGFHPSIDEYRYIILPLFKD